MPWLNMSAQSTVDASEQQTLTCPRCGFSTKRSDVIRAHVSRKRQCPCVKSDVTPCMENIIRSGGRKFTASTTRTGVSVTACDNVTIDSHDTYNITINVNQVARDSSVLPWSYEDMSHITPDVWKRICKLAVESPKDGLQAFINLVNYNPAVPQNMNMYVPAEGPAYVFLVNGNRWHKIDRERAVQWLIGDRATDIGDYISENPQVLPPEEAHKFMRFFRTHQTWPSDAVALVEMMTSQGSKLVRVVHGASINPDAPPVPF